MENVDRMKNSTQNGRDFLSRKYFVDISRSTAYYATKYHRLCSISSSTWLSPFSRPLCVVVA